MKRVIRKSLVDSHYQKFSARIRELGMASKTKIYTKKGDQGNTGLFGGGQVRKNNPRVEAYGNIDELNSVIGITIAQCANAEIRNFLSQIQHDLFAIGSDLATPESDSKLRKAVEINCSDLTGRIEEFIDKWEARLSPLRNFILPGGSTGSAYLHLARTVCRRAERSIVFLSDSEPINMTVIPYINRLSDLLFVLARVENMLAKVPDQTWGKQEKVS